MKLELPEEAEGKDLVDPVRRMAEEYAEWRTRKEWEESRRWEATHTYEAKARGVDDNCEEVCVREADINHDHGVRVTCLEVYIRKDEKYEKDLEVKTTFEAKRDEDKIKQIFYKQFD